MGIINAVAIIGEAERAGLDEFTIKHPAFPSLAGSADFLSPFLGFFFVSLGVAGLLVAFVEVLASALLFLGVLGERGDFVIVTCK